MASERCACRAVTCTLEREMKCHSDHANIDARMQSPFRREIIIPINPLRGVYKYSMRIDILRSAIPNQM